MLQCIVGSHDWWEFHHFKGHWQSPCGARTTRFCLSLGLCKETVKESTPPQLCPAMTVRRLRLRLRLRSLMRWCFCHDVGSTGCVTLVAITGTSIMAPYLKIKSLQLIWKLSTLRFPLQVPCLQMCVRYLTTLIARFMGPTWGLPGADRTQVGPMLAPWSLLSGYRAGYQDCYPNN